jgi:hypothetical protein
VKRAAIVACVLASAGSAIASPPPKPPPASTEPELPPGVTLEPVAVPTGPGFKARPAKWWKKGKKACPAGAKLTKIANDRPATLASERWVTAFVCRDAEGKQHGPGVALFENGKPFEDSWSEHGKHIGMRWTWGPDGKLSHLETFVDGKLQGPASEWSGKDQIAAGQYKDDERYGLWTLRHPTGLVMRGYYVDGGEPTGTWIGTRDGVATAIVVGDLGERRSELWRVFDAAGLLTFERRIDEVGGTATGYKQNVRIAEYDCGLDGTIGESRFFDDEGLLLRRWNDRTETLTDRAGATLPITDEQKKRLHGVRDACTGPMWMLEGPPPSRDAALK